MSDKKKSVALFFGSFNPIHVGHMIIAQQVLNTKLTNEVWFVVSPHNPHKEKETLLADYHRMALVREAIYDEPKFSASDIEFHLDKPSYTVDTLVHLREKYRAVDFSLILGEDNLRTFHKWKNFEEITKNHNLLVYRRKINDSIVPSENAGNKDLPITIDISKVKYIAGEMLDISSTQIRNLISDGKSARYYLTEPVFKYVTEMGFYKSK